MQLIVGFPLVSRFDSVIKRSQSKDTQVRCWGPRANRRGLLSGIDDKSRVDWSHESQVSESPGRKETEVHVSENTNSLRVGAGLVTQSVAITNLSSQHRSTAGWKVRGAELR